MAKKTGLQIKFVFPLKRFKRVSTKALSDGLEKAGISMLDWMASGGPKSESAPPIRRGILAASGSVFVGNKLIKTTADQPVSGGQSQANKSYSGKAGQLTFGFNTVYATRMHEDDSLNPGKFSSDSKNRAPGNGWVREHLKLEKDELMKVLAAFVDKAL